MDGKTKLLIVPTTKRVDALSAQPTERAEDGKCKFVIIKCFIMNWNTFGVF